MSLFTPERVTGKSWKEVWKNPKRTPPLPPEKLDQIPFTLDTELEDYDENEYDSDLPVIDQRNYNEPISGNRVRGFKSGSRAYDKGRPHRTNSPNGTLTQLLWDFIVHFLPNPEDIAGALDRYITNPVNLIPQNAKDRSSARGNINKAIHQSEMTFKTFTTGIRLLRAKKYRITIELWAPDPKTGEIQHVIKAMEQEGDQN